MTREIAIKTIQDFQGWFKKESLIYKALCMAISALEQQPCEDAVSREAVLMIASSPTLSINETVAMIKRLPSVTVRQTDILDRRIDDKTVVFKTLDGKETEYVERQTGEWIYSEKLNNWQCSKCHQTVPTKGYCGDTRFMNEKFKYCPLCGSQMRELQI